MDLRSLTMLVGESGKSVRRTLCEASHLDQCLEECQRQRGYHRVGSRLKRHILFVDHQIHHGMSET